jgi:sialate O-acetylesterase
MVNKVPPYTIRGVIWYQGESDDTKPALYATVFGKMIECWRNLWKDQL